MTPSYTCALHTCHPLPSSARPCATVSAPNPHCCACPTCPPQEQFHLKYKDSPFDVVVDLVGGDYHWQSLAVLKKGGYFGNVLNSGYMHK